ncbi:unnamed protein product [Allacma fusca]|uniref:Uncharacterized protein n=1 Tax=Allacma fusca TaxID=39272 RepID=A0A8J2PWX4_9HEXA|nr:unnamed protein product [Allacma fusca]
MDGLEYTWVSDYMDQEKPQLLAACASLAKSFVELYSGNNTLKRFTKIESFVRNGPEVDCLKTVDNEVECSKLTKPTKSEVLRFCKNECGMVGIGIQKQQQELLKTIELEKRQFANKQLLFSMATNLKFLYDQYISIKNTWRHIKSVQVLIETNTEHIRIIKMMLKRIDKNAARICALLTVLDGRKSISPKDVGIVHDLSTKMSKNLKKVAKMFDAIKIKTQNGIYTMRSCTVSQKRAMGLNLLQVAMNCLQLAIVGSPGSFGMKMGFGAITSLYFGAARLNYKNTVSMEEKLKVLSLQMKTIHELGDHIKKLKRILTLSEKFYRECNKPGTGKTELKVSMPLSKKRHSYRSCHQRR